MKTPVVPLPAATITVVRDVDAGFEVLMMQRNPKSVFMPGAYVFPGGGIDSEDREPAMYDLCAGLDDAAASRILGLERDGLAYFAGAIRECFEESGLLLCYRDSGDLITLDTPEIEARFTAHRAALNAGRLGFLEFCRNEGLRLAVDRLTYFSHWITPVGAPRRYDTRFFAAVAPARQSTLHDDQELTDHVWVRPQDALARDEAGTLSLRTPTKATLRQLAAASDTESLIKALGSQKEIRTHRPVVGPNGKRLLPGEPGYEEAALDPTPKWT